jgi:membrane-associated phospholipid phosphatase
LRQTETARLTDRLQAVDEALTRPLTLPPRRGPAQVIALVLAHSGDSYIWGGLAVLAWFLGDSQWKARAVMTLAGLILAEVVVIGVKWIIRRRRPPGTSGGIYRKTDPYSFPSGHAARAVLLCILSGMLGPLAAFIGILVWSPFMVVSRIAIGIHYVLDVVGGLFLGVVLTIILLQFAPLLTSWI